MPAVSVLQILRTIKERGSISRTDLQQITRLSWGTITNTTRELLNRNLIREEGALSTKAGRKPMKLALNPSGHCLVGVEIAPDYVRCLVMNLAGEALGYEQSPGAAGSESAEIVLERTAAIINRRLGENAGRICMGVGVAVPGALEVKNGIVRYAPRLPNWKDVPVRRILQERLSAAVLLEHNPNCLALAERWFGDAHHADNLLCIHLGEGVGMGIILDGEIFRGSQDMAGEFGHVTVDPEGPVCACGDRGCVEAYCSASALVGYAQSVAEAGDVASKVRTVDELAALASQGNKTAKETFVRMGRHLGIGVANLIDLFNPDMVVLAGRSTIGKDHFVATLEREVNAHAWRQSGREVLVSRLGERATAMGACGMILQAALAHATSEKTSEVLA